MECSDEELGRAVQSALDGSAENVSHPVQWSGVLAPLLTEAGVKSWKTFAKSAACVEIEQDGETITLIPTANRGVDEGYEAIMAKQVTLFSPDNDTLGSKLREALAQVE